MNKYHMKRFLIIFVFSYLLFISSVSADVDTFTINTAYGSPTYYTIDYGQYTTANVYNYSIESSTDLAANQSWLLLGSTNNDVVDTLDTQNLIGFNTAILQNFTVSSPGDYRYYYLVMTGGFGNTTTTLVLKFYSTTINMPSPYMTATPIPVIGIPMLPAASSKSVPVQWIDDRLAVVVIVLVAAVAWLIIRRR
jgi:hypothetical protein